MPKKSEESRCILAVRVRGLVSAKREARETMKLLRLTHTNHAVIMENSDAICGMLRAVQSYVTWGEPSKETVNALIKKRARLLGNKKINEEYLQKMNFKSMDDLADAVFQSSTKYSELPTIQPVFKLHPPSKGFKGSVKKSHAAGGELGYRGEKINELINRMF